MKNENSVQTLAHLAGDAVVGLSILGVLAWIVGWTVGLMAYAAQSHKNRKHPRRRRKKAAEALLLYGGTEMGLAYIFVGVLVGAPVLLFMGIIYSLFSGMY